MAKRLSETELDQLRARAQRATLPGWTWLLLIAAAFCLFAVGELL